MFYSADARSFIKEWGDSLQAVDCYDRNLVTMLAERGARGCHKLNLVSLQSAIRHGYQADIDGNIWQSALYQAVDMCNWSMADALLRFDIKTEPHSESPGDSAQPGAPAGLFQAPCEG